MRDAIPAYPASRPIFMVDDEEIDRLLFTRLLRTAEVSNPVRIFSQAEHLIDALIEVLRGARPPLVCFLDIKMPGMTGFDVLRWIRCQRALDEMPVVMLSSSEQTRDVSEAQVSGAQCYVTKLPTPEHFRAILQEAARVASTASSGSFQIPCNLLLGAPHTSAV